MQLSVLFCDQVGSTALLTRLGDALGDEVRRDMFEALLRAADLCRGDVVKSSGDGLMVVFSSGPADALKCGELMVRSIARLAERELWSDVQIRVGVSHGEVISDQGDWYGAAVNLAARFCAAAPDGEVMASAAIVDAVAPDDRAWQVLPNIQLKGFPDQVEVRALHVDHRDLPRSPIAVELDLEGMTPLVGRDDALVTLLAAFEGAAAGPADVVTVVGAAGMGVTRVLAELSGRVGSRAVVLSATSDASAGCVEQLMRSHAAITRLSDLRADVGDDGSVLAAICPLIGLRLGVAPQRHNELSDEKLLLRLVARIARRAPVLVLLDGTGAVAGFWREMPPRSLVVIGARATVARFDAGEVLTLQPLAPAEVGVMVNPVVSGRWTGEASIVELVVFETDGVPRDVVAVMDELTRSAARGQSRVVEALAAVRRAVPYMGLQTFGGDDSVRFFGRERAAEEVLTTVAERSFVTLVGSSGSGKSSLVRAGCLPRLVQQGSDLVVLAPGEEPMRALAAALCRTRDGNPAALLDDGPFDASLLADLVTNGRPVVVVIDQLEECFTLCTDEQSRARFFDTITTPLPELRVLATLRGDFFGRASEHLGMAEALRGGTVLISPPTLVELRTVIEAPARAAHLRLEPGLSDLILSDVTDRSGSLPLLSHALRETWRRRHGRTLSIAGYREAGGATGAIARTADSVFEHLTISERDVARRIFLRLTALGEGAEDARRRVPVNVLLATDTEEGMRVLGILTAARLVTADIDADGQDVDELAHEALLREWPRLRAWLDEDRDELRLLAHLESAARDWDAGGRPEGELYSGRRLEASEAVSKNKLNDRELAFLKSSLDLREALQRAGRRATRRLRASAAVLAVLLVAAVVSASLAFVQRSSALSQARHALASRLAAETTSALAAQPDLALLLAAQSNAVNSQDDTKAALVTALGHVGPLVGVHHELGDYYSAAVHPDGRTVAAVYTDGTFQFWDLSTRHLSAVQPAPIHGTPTDVRFSLDGSIVAVGTVDASNKSLLEVRDTATGVAIGAAIPAFGPVPNGQITVLAISPDNQFIAADAFDTGSVAIWHIGDGRQTVPPVHLTDVGVQEVRFSPDGRSVLVDLYDGSLARIDVATGALNGPLAHVFDSPSGAMAVAPSGSRVAIGDITGQVAVVDYTTGKIVAGPVSLGDMAFTLLFTPDGRSLIVGQRGGSIVGLDAETLAPNSAPLTAHTAGVFFLAKRADRLVSVGTGEIAEWNLSGDLPLASNTTAHDTAGGAALDSSGRLLVTVGSGPPARLWRMSDEFKPSDDGTITGLTFSSGAVVGVSSDGSRVAVASGATVDTGRVDGTALDIFSLPDAGHLGTVDFGPDIVRDLAFSPNGSELAVVTHSEHGAGLGTIQILSTNDMHLIAKATNVPSDLVVWPTPDSVVIGQGALIEVLDPNTAQPRFPKYTSSPEIVSVAAGGAAGDIIFGRNDGTLLQFDPASGLGTGTIATDLDARVTAVGISADGRLAAAGTEGGAMALVDMVARHAIGGAISTGNTAVVGAFVNSNGAHVLTVDASGRTLAWAIDETLWRSQACALAGRNLTRTEWDRYVGGQYRATCTNWSPDSAAQ